MNRNIFLFLIISIILIVSGCTVIEGEVKDRIISPENSNIPISGKWEASYIFNEEFIPIDDEEKIQELNMDVYNLEAYFHREGVAVGERFTEEPSFRIKNVLAYNYLSNNFRFTPDDLEIENERLEVITVLNDGTYLLDFVRLEEEMILARYDDVFYIFERVHEEVSGDEIARYIQVQKDVMKTLGPDEEEDLQTGFLLGLKIPAYDQTSNNADWDYKTIWINTTNGNVNSVYELDKLILPRKNGFWEIIKERNFKESMVRDTISATPLFLVEEDNKATINKSSIDDLVEILDTNQIKSELKNILFVGNDYISLEKIDLLDNEKKILQIYSLDNIRGEIPIKLSDLVGEDGRDLFIEGARNEMSLDDKKIPNEENIGLFRMDGHWSLKGRINYFQSGEELHGDFNIRAIPPSNMVSYDDQIEPFNMVNLVSPGLVDYFTSPNGEFIVALTSTQVTVYPIKNGEIVNTRNVRFSIPDNASVIMSEWARGRYTESWEQEVIDNGGVKIDY